jgi:uncharacterized membrane protein YbhN (UPF0104 family)
VRYNKLMSRKFLRSLLAAGVLIVTTAAFAYYLSNHPEAIRQLRQLPPMSLFCLLLLYCFFLVALTWIQRATLSLCDITLGRKESLLLVMYSSIINFFGPLQSGPAFRAAYLKRKHNVKLKNYTLATLLYYVFYAIFSALFIMTYFVGLWGLLAVIAIVALIPLLLKNPRFVPVRFRTLRLEHIGQLAAATLAQVSTLAVIFYVELGSVGKHIAAVPTLIYTGAANFALFVSVTPGAIGFRESFLVFSQRLHHIVNGQIVSASLIDRGVYVIFLGLLALFVFGLHAQNYLKPDTSDEAGNTTRTTGKN